MAKAAPCRFYTDEAIERLQKMRARSIDHCITDPPYNISGYDGKGKIGWLKSNSVWTEEKKFTKIEEKWDKFSDDDYDQFTLEWIREVCRVVKPNGNILVFGSFHNIYTIGHILKDMRKKIVGSITWYKRNAFPNITRRMLCESTEYIVWAVNNDVKDAKNWTFNYDVLKEMNGGIQMRNVWDVPMTPASEKKHGKHPAQKPMEVCRRLVLGMTNSGDLILDPFAGSGSIPLAAKSYGRRYVAIEREARYSSIAKKRLATAIRAFK